MTTSKSKILSNFDDLINSVNIKIDEAVETKNVDWNFLGIWKEAVIRSIELVFQNQSIVSEFQSISFTSHIINPSRNEQNIAYLVGLISARSKLLGLRYTIDRWLEDEQEIVQAKSTPLVFVAHGGSHCDGKLEKIKAFLIAIGAQPIIVEDLPDMGLSVNEKVKLYMEISNIAIVLITAEDNLKSGEIQGRHNISHEIGLMQNSPNLAGRIIILKEESVKLPSNYSQFVYESFSKKDISNGLIKIAKEFRAYGYI